MKLAQLLSIYPQLRWGDDPSREVTALVSDSRQVIPGAVFVAVKGGQVDGHQYLGAVVEAGAQALIVSEPQAVPRAFGGAVVVVPDTREALSLLAARYYGAPAEKLFCMGVTGTNGKTSITYMVECILNRFGWPTGVIGTVDHHLQEHHWPSLLTTPDGLTLHKRLHEFVTLGAKAVAFEVSSHALEQHRVDGLSFDAAVFTNLTRDHLDYHGDMDHYFAAKERLFHEILGRSPKTSRYAIINGDDAYGRRIQSASRVNTWYYGRKDADLRFKVKSSSFAGCKFELETPRGKQMVEIPVTGLHNVYNVTAAIGVGLAAGVSLETCVEAVRDFTGVPGRLQRVAPQAPYYVFVDYAHTDDALHSVLSALLEVRGRSKHRIITVFGCGGDRDKGKRPLMAKVAFEMSDVILITSDNPRTEDPEAIIADCLRGIPKGKTKKEVITEVDRRKAIGRALKMAKAKDVVLIAGKGHEDYQIIGKEKRPFSDVQVVKELIL